MSSDKVQELLVLVTSMRNEPERQIRVNLLESICEFLLYNSHDFCGLVVPRTGRPFKEIIVAKLTELKIQLNPTRTVELNVKQLIERTITAYH